MISFQDLKKVVKNKKANGKPVRVAILGDSATQFFTVAIKGASLVKDINLDIWEADFNQIERQIADPSSELYSFNPEVVVVFESSQKLLKKYDASSASERGLLADNKLNELSNYCDLIASRIDAKVIYLNYSEINDAVYGDFASQVESSFLFQIRKLNFGLNQLSIDKPQLFICDLSSVQNQIGRERFFHSAMYITSDMVLSIEALPLVAFKIAEIISMLQGKLKKCLILDLDNTTWGGVIGDDGIENIQIGSLGIGKAFTDLQYWAKKLKERGIILAICSKNTESVAKEPFLNHPDMVLRLEDISVFVANWENKADNIRHIQQVLNIGFDSMVFIDDNPFERNIVRENLPEVTVPELPEDPAEYLEFLRTQNLFDTISISKEDADRTRLYQIEAKRAANKVNFTDVNDYLKSLEMTSKVEGFTQFNMPRAAQLSQRSNQFNLRTIRYSDADVNRIATDANYHEYTFTLDDKYGENGLIAIVVLKQESENSLFIENWLMSCRVLKRGMENFVLNTIVDFAKNNNFEVIRGEYIETAKNSMVKDHYSNLGFEVMGDNFELAVGSYEPRPTFIKRK